MNAAAHFLQSTASPQLMGIVNVTPNSFSDGGLHQDADRAVAHARQLAADGAALIDFGAEASSFFRPGVTPVEAAAQLERLLPVMERLAAAPLARDAGPVWISIDTRSATVARACVAAGAHLINDISAGTHDPAMLSTTAELGCPIILMHISPGYPATPAADDPDIVSSVRACLAARIAAARAAGIPPENILVDPGVGFGKTPADNWRLAAAAGGLEASLGHRVVLGLSRKRFLSAGLSMPEDPQFVQRDQLTAVATVLAAGRGVRLHRVHNVRVCAAALAVAARFA